MFTYVQPQPQVGYTDSSLLLYPLNTATVSPPSITQSSYYTPYKSYYAINGSTTSNTSTTTTPNPTTRTNSKKWYLYSNLASDVSPSLRSSQSSIVTMISTATTTSHKPSLVMDDLSKNRSSAHLNTNYWKQSGNYDRVYLATPIVTTTNSNELVVYDLHLNNNNNNNSETKIRRSYVFGSNRYINQNQPTVSNNFASNLMRKCSLPAESEYKPIRQQLVQLAQPQNEYSQEQKKSQPTTNPTTYDQLYTYSPSVQTVNEQTSIQIFNQFKTSGNQSAFKQVGNTLNKPPSTTITADFTPRLIKNFRTSSSFLKRKPSTLTSTPNTSLTSNKSPDQSTNNKTTHIYVNDTNNRNLTDITTASLNDGSLKVGSKISNDVKYQKTHHIFTNYAAIEPPPSPSKTSSDWTMKENNDENSYIGNTTTPTNSSDKLSSQNVRRHKTLLRKKKTTERKCIALCDYKSLYSKNINLLSGETYTILNSSNDNWFLVKDKQDNVGYAPSNYLQDIDNEKPSQETLNDKIWYHGNITRMQAYLRLTEYPIEDGTFLIRVNSTEHGKYTLCLYFSGKVYNYKINSQNEQLYISSKNKFSNLIELIEFYKQNSYGLVSPLKHPLARNEGMLPPETAGFGYKKFHIERNDLNFLEKIGSGQFGIVLKADYKNCKIVAVKKMKPGSIDDEINFNREAEFMMKLQNLQELQHRNLVQFYGVSKDIDCSILIVTEYVKHGSLSNYLTKHKDRLQKSRSRVFRLLNICMDVCDGMEYLESKHVVHRDLATRNCLVGDGEIVKVADFGLARFTDDYYIANPQSQFPVKWSAPEVIKYRSYSNKSDVWSFGCLMYEVFSFGKMPYGSNTSNSLAAKQIMAGIVPEKPPYCQTNLYENVMLKAWNKEYENRPSFKQLIQMLNDFNK